MLMTLRQIPDRSLNWIPSDRIRRHNTTLLLSSVAQSDLITVNAFVLVFLVMRGALILVNGYFSNCLSLFMTHSLSCFSTPVSSPLLSFLSVSQGWGRAALQLPSSEPGMTSSHSSLVLGSAYSSPWSSSAASAASPAYAHTYTQAHTPTARR